MKSRGKIKKPSFILTYCGCFVIVAAFLALIGFIIYGDIAGTYNERAIRETQSAESSMNRIITLTLNKETVTPQDIASLRQYLVWHYWSTGQCFEVYYNQKKIADSSKTMIMQYSPAVMEGERSETHFFELADPKYLKYFETPEVQNYKFNIAIVDFSEGPSLTPKYETQPVITLGVKEAYIDIENARFIPVECYVMDPDSTHQLMISNLKVSIPVDKDSPKLKGYTYLKSDGINNFAATIGGQEGSGPDYTGSSVSTNDYGIYFGYKSTDVKVIDFEDVFKNEIMLGNCVLVVVIFALTLIPAAFLYSRKKRNYEVFEYRRKMTDAMAHDLKTPMAAILTYAENLENHTGADKQEFYVSKISEKVWQMNKMVNNMLDFSRGENSAVTVKKSPVDIGAVLADAIAENEHEITKRGLNVDYEKKSVTVNTDKDLFAQAIGNLINNAALYAKESSTITVTCEPGKIIISNVAAEAVEDASAMKQPFAKGSESRKNMGSGLGLAIAENNLVLLGYKLDVRGEDGKFVVTVTMS